MNIILREVLPCWFDLTHDQQEQLQARSISQKFTKGEMIFDSMMMASGYKIIKSGQARISIPSTHGGELLLYRLGKSEICFLTGMHLMEQYGWDLHMDAQQDCEVITLPESLCRIIGEANPVFKEYILTTSIESLGKIVYILNNLASANMEQRISRLLLSVWEESGSNEICLTHEMIAKDIGTVREVASRTLKRLETIGLIKLNRGKVFILDTDGLKSVCCGQY